MAHKTTIATKEKNERLYRAILALETEEECYAFFQDLCTIAELRSMEQRYEVATLLSEGMVYSDILERTGASSATISRVNRALLNGTGGYVSVLREAGGLSGKALPPQPYPRPHGAGSGLRHRHHDVAADRPGL